jgi:hypothetical protein
MESLKATTKKKSSSNDNIFSTLVPLPAQNNLISAVMNLVDIPYYFFLGGYGSGKSFCIILLLLIILKKYAGYNVRILLCGITLGDISKLILVDFFKILSYNNIPYRHDKKVNIVHVNDTTIFCKPIQDPQLIYGDNVEIQLIDEIDELKKDTADQVFKALAERLRGNRLPDREPFSCFFTTTQGKKRACYQKLRQFKELGIRYALVRGRTEDNRYNASSYVDNLKAVYSEEEQKAFLHGYFMDLSSGRVYSDFEEQTMVIQPFEILPNETIYIGQDKNIGYNKAVCVIVREGIIYNIRVFSTQAVQDVPRIVRSTYPTNPIYWYPDASAAEIIGGYTQELARYDIHLQLAKFNPSILARVFVVNKLYKLGKCLVFKELSKELINAHDGRTFDDQGKPEKIQGEKCPSHVCDADEYVKWRLVMTLPQFAMIRSLAEKIKGTYGT